MLTVSNFRFHKSDLDQLANERAEEFQSNLPFPHIVFENFLPDEIAQELAREFPKPGQITWNLAGPGDSKHTNDPNVEKITTSNEDVFPPLTRHVMHEFNSGTFVEFLGKLTGYKHL